MQQVYFVRHCTSDASVHEEIARPLSEQGLREAEALKKYFQNMPVNRVISSPARRALETVQGIAESHYLPIEQDVDLREREVGIWVDDFWDFVRQQWEDFDYSIPGGESLRDVMRRYLMALGRIVDGYSGVTVCGTHGTALSVLVNAYKADFGYEQFMQIVDKMPWVVCFSFEGSQLVDLKMVEIDCENA